jgi:hypothetical protein
MATTVENRILAKLLDPLGECLTPTVAARIAGLRASSSTTRRVGELAAKNSAGTLTHREEMEYSAYVEAFDVIAILQAKARKAIKSAGRAG